LYLRSSLDYTNNLDYPMAIG